MEMAKLRVFSLWVLRVLVAAVFIMAGSHKLLGDPMMVDMFGKIGLGQGFRYVTGIIEVGAAILALWPKTTFYGAVVMLCVLLGALVTQLFVMHGDIIHVFVIAVFVSGLAWAQRPRRIA